MKILRPFLAAALFFVLVLYFTPSIPQGSSQAGLYYTISSLLPFHLNPAVPHSLTQITGYQIHITSFEEYFIGSPFNMETEGNPLLNLYLPTLLIFMLGVYLKNFNSAFQKKCSLRAVFIIAIIASYVKSWGSMLYYHGYSDFGISLGTSIITLCFLAAFLISLEVYIEGKEKVEHLYGHFIFAVLSCLLLLLAVMVFFSFFASSSFLVHAMGLTAFLVIFIPYYERANIRKFMAKEERALIHQSRSAA
jgi:hypothetical protein